MLWSDGFLVNSWIKIYVFTMFLLNTRTKLFSRSKIGNVFEYQLPPWRLLCDKYKGLLSSLIFAWERFDELVKGRVGVFRIWAKRFLSTVKHYDRSACTNLFAAEIHRVFQDIFRPAILVQFNRFITNSAILCISFYSFVDKNQTTNSGKLANVHVSSMRTIAPLYPV